MSHATGETHTHRGIDSADTRQALIDWLAHKSHDHASFDEAEVLAAKSERIGVILPARDVPTTIAPILDVLMGLQRQGWIDEVLVVTAADDPTLSVVREWNVDVIDESRPANGAGPSVGKGDAIWRGLGAVKSEIAVLLDTDTENFGRHFLIGLVAPLLLDRNVAFVKGTFRRPLRIGDITMESEGGRVSELVARPLLNLFFPELAVFVQPLAGEVALRRELWTQMQIPAGFGVEIAMLIDAWKIGGLNTLAQVDLGRRHDTSKMLRDLVPMAQSVMAAVLRRLPEKLEPQGSRLLIPQADGMVEVGIVLDERPALGTRN